MKWANLFETFTVIARSGPEPKAKDPRRSNLLLDPAAGGASSLSSVIARSGPEPKAKDPRRSNPLIICHCEERLFSDEAIYSPLQDFRHLSLDKFGCTLMQSNLIMNYSNLFKKHISLPQDHGSWVFILSPLIIGIFASNRFTSDTAILVLTAMSAFFLRQPLSILVKVISNRRDRFDLPPALTWAGLYGLLSLAGLFVLIFRGFVFLLYLAVPGILVFGWHLWLISRRQERKQAGVEIIASGVLALAAPAAFWVGLSSYQPAGWWLWLLVWLQSAASIVYAYLRLEQRELINRNRIANATFGLVFNDQINNTRFGLRSILYTSFNLILTAILSIFGILPAFIALPYLLQCAETMWGLSHPAVGWKPTRIGFRQLIVSSLWTILFVIVWRL